MNIKSDQGRGYKVILILRKRETEGKIDGCKVDPEVNPHSTLNHFKYLIAKLIWDSF